MKATIKIRGMHCSSCAMTIDDQLEGLSGVTRAKTSYAKQQVEVEVDPALVDESQLVAAVLAAGYAAG